MAREPGIDEGKLTNDETEEKVLTRNSVARSIRATAVAVVCIVAVSTTEWTSPDVLAATDVIVEPVVPAVCSIRCTEPGYCESGEHDAYYLQFEYYNAIANGGEHSGPPYCREYTCDVRHGYLPCEPNIGGESAVERLRVALANEDAAAVVVVLGALPERVTLNSARAAIQVTNCNGNLIAHLPVAKKMIERIQTLP